GSAVDRAGGLLVWPPALAGPRPALWGGTGDDDGPRSGRHDPALHHLLPNSGVRVPGIGCLGQYVSATDGAVVAGGDGVRDLSDAPVHAEHPGRAVRGG